MDEHEYGVHTVRAGSDIKEFLAIFSDIVQEILQN